MRRYFIGCQFLNKNTCTVSTRKASHHYEPACAFSGCRPQRLSSCIGCSCISFSNQFDPWCWDLLSIEQLDFPWFGYVCIATRCEKNWQNLHGHEGIFQKSESECFLASPAHPETALQQFVVEGRASRLFWPSFTTCFSSLKGVFPCFLSSSVWILTML